MKILAVDTTLGACSAALLAGDDILARRRLVMDRGHAEALAPMVEEVMREADLSFQHLDRLAVTIGPGTFTGQRVGLAFMRGLRTALAKPLLGTTSLAAMAEQACFETGVSCAAAIHDARRGEVYFEAVGTPVSARLLTFGEACSVLGELSGKIILAGTAAPRVAKVVRARGIETQISDVVAPDAVWVARLAAGMEPGEHPPRALYLRAPDAKLPAKHA
ncbi:MAG: tRNA (adenosine(37)-N6)-threonylcarbamoyltransferase complex dimerization subunit type 1 TsaB [Alphaproteobacteria bacterium]|nr:tRNA (adenosine(37)-N6)-threonylcarbamoyltransferase complex dimerization subunit type 1 TsaB [Alphaproteobacteria bacterium]MDE2630540.1 tRNA (adenosine(37)-N6)-threonylcarbamoyltransferase complex dimerization subunit type 1 TsaB [Alphaproteobacteria bacterium]